jgi:hypothetical protein
MAGRYMHEVLTPAVLDAERRYYNRTYATAPEAPEPEALRDEDRDFIQSRDSFYMATITENGWPYLTANNRVSLFLMDYPARERLKILGHAKVLDAREHPDLVVATAPPGGHPATVERIMVIDVLSYDWNCTKFITPRFTAAEIESAIASLKVRIAELEAQLWQAIPRSADDRSLPFRLQQKSSSVNHS